MFDREPLTTLMAAGPMDVAEVIRVGREVADSLERSGVHGELWPSAIAVGDSVGIMPSGTADRNRWLQYAAPERLLGKPATAASDVFSLAGILFHALAGRPPFSGESAAEIMLAVCSNDVPVNLQHFRADVPPDLSTVIMRALSKDPAQRYASLGSFRDALDTIGARQAWPGRRILVADDDGPIRDLYTHLAARIGVEVDVVASGRDAVEAFKSRKYDVALMDLNMPRLSGWEVLDFLRHRYDFRPKRLFIVTGFSDQLISKADHDVVSAVLYKPVVTDELRELVVACLRSDQVNVAAILKTTPHRVSPA